MKVLIFSLAYLPFVGGAEVAVKEITERISDSRFDMITLNLDGNQKTEEKIGNIHVYRLGKGIRSKSFFPFTAFRFAKKLHEKNRYDAIWAIMANRAGLAASWFKEKFPEIPFLLTLQEGDSLFDIWKKTFYMRIAYKNIYRRADYIQAISTYLEKRAKKMGARCPILVVPNGVRQSPATGHRSLELKKKLGIEGNNKVIITVSRLVKKNGVDTVLRSIQALRIKNKEFRVRLIIAGGGKLAGKLKNVAKMLKIQDAVFFLGHVDPDKVSEYLNIADIFVRPSRSEGLGSAFLEAMGAGIPVIGTPVGGIPDFLQDYQTGLFCNVDDPKDLAEKIQALLSDTNLFQKLSENGKKLVEEKYQWDGIARMMERIFRQLVQGEDGQ